MMKHMRRLKRKKSGLLQSLIKSHRKTSTYLTGYELLGNRVNGYKLQATNVTQVHNFVTRDMITAQPRL